MNHAGVTLCTANHGREDVHCEHKDVLQVALQRVSSQNSSARFVIFRTSPSIRMRSVDSMSCVRAFQPPLSYSHIIKNKYTSSLLSMRPTSFASISSRTRSIRITVSRSWPTAQFVH